ncbi:MAG: hypothetical protein DRN47_01805 [Candidatus Wolframiiraptor sp.]|nr:MAG: hypothetical protein DRN47_01805 [Candidatus Wolframiiraptor sp.]
MKSLRLEDKLYWGRFVGGILMGFLTALLRLYEPTIFVGIIIMAAVYVFSTIIIKGLLKEESRKQLGRKLYTSGAATYIVMWLIVLVITFNVLQAL